jgi:hypothetical protein
MSRGPVLKIGRRHFLQGVGGFALAIPFLPSLERSARAAGPPVQPRYFYIENNHGGCWDNNFYPSMALPNSQPVPGIAGHTVSSGPLAPTTANGRTTLSAVLNASSTVLTPALVAKMNLLRGLDVPWYLAHNTGLLGNFARNDGNGGDGGAVQMMDNGGRPTIDQVMAASNTFYTAADRASLKTGVLVLGAGATQPHSWALTSPGNVQGGVTPVTDSLSSLPLFQSIFGNGMAAATRKPVVDLVLGNYQSLTQSNARLSAADQVRLSQHMDMLSQLESTLNASLTCTTPAAPADNRNYGIYGSTPNPAKWGQLFADVAAAAFACNATRISVFGFGDTSGFSPGFQSSGLTDWHQQVAHKWFTDQAQGWLVESYQGLFEQVVVYLAAALDAIQDANGQTVLDNSLLVWGQECGMSTHDSYGIQTVTFGGAGGTLNTGLICDYRQLGQAGCAISPGAGSTGLSAQLNGFTTYPGLLWEQWLATQLLLMGVPSTEWLLWKDASGAVQQGYGTPYLNALGTWETPYAKHYMPANPGWTTPGSPLMSQSPYFANASNPLPFLLK